jgi:hypothetical protein
MDEQVWVAWRNATDVETLLRLTRGNNYQRKLRLFACACARRLLAANPLPGSERFVSFAERFADSPGSPSLLLDAAEQARRSHGALADVVDPFGDLSVFKDAMVARAVRATVHHHSRPAAEFAYRSLRDFEDYTGGPAAELHIALVREVFGNPFEPIDYAPWRSDTAVSLARQMYDGRDFGAMPILADALQDAGCDNDDVLNHCRDANATHVRGCWVVDGVLGLS